MFTTLLKISYLRFKYRFLPNKAQAFWAQELLEAQGLGAKLGQILAQGKKTSLPKSTITRAEASALFQKNFHRELKVNSEGLAASMGQVFMASIDDESIAVKILHPGIRERLKKEISNILLLGGYYAKAKEFRFDEKIFRNFLEDVFAQETDLRSEARYQMHFHKIFSADERFWVPVVRTEFSNEAILSQELVPSTLAQELTTFTHFDIFHFFFRALLEHGLLHGDLNDRNWGLTQKNRTVVYDYGCAQIVSDRRTNGLKKLILNKDIAQGFVEFGLRLEATSFKNREQELRDAVIGLLFDQPLRHDLEYGRELQKKFGEKIRELREHTDPWVLLMMRSLFSLIRVYQDRGVDVPLHDIVRSYLMLKEGPVSARFIKIDVTEKGESVVALTLPITALDNLEALMPGPVHQTVVAEGIDVVKLIERANASGLAPQDLFSLSAADRHYRVWIE